MSNNTSSRRATLSSTPIPVPPPQTHIPDNVNQPPAQSFLSVSPLLSGERRNSQPQLSSSAPSFGSFLNAENRGSNDNSSHNSTKGDSTSNSPVLAIEFDGGTHVIVRPNRIIRGKFLYLITCFFLLTLISTGKVILNLSERIHVIRIRIKVKSNFRVCKDKFIKMEC